MEPERHTAVEADERIAEERRPTEADTPFSETRFGMAIRWIAFLPVGILAFGVGEFLTINGVRLCAGLPYLVWLLAFVPLIAVCIAIAIFVAAVACAIAPSRRAGALLFGLCVTLVQAVSLILLVSRKGFDAVAVVKLLFLGAVLLSAKSMYAGGDK